MLSKVIWDSGLTFFSPLLQCVFIVCFCVRSVSSEPTVTQQQHHKNHSKAKVFCKAFYVIRALMLLVQGRKIMLPLRAAVRIHPLMLVCSADGTEFNRQVVCPMTRYKRIFFFNSLFFLETIALCVIIRDPIVIMS